MNYMLVYFGYSKYYGCKRRHYIEFKDFSYLLRHIINNNIKDFTIYKKYDIVESEDIINMEDEKNG